MTSRRIIFMGSGPFAYQVLKNLSYSEHELLLVYTKKAQTQNRGMHLIKNSVQLLAEEIQVPVTTPESLKEQKEVLAKLPGDLIIVASYGFIIPKELLSIYRYGAINLHPSDLPRWRGAAPLERTMMAGDDMTALCVMQMDPGLDTGDILMKKSIPVDLRFTGRELMIDYAKASSCLLLETLQKLDTITAVAQSEKGITYADKIRDTDEKINWQESGLHIVAKIMALSPKAFCYYKDQRLRIVEAELMDLHSQLQPGQIVSSELEVAAGDGRLIKIHKIQKAGGKVLTSQAFLCGTKIMPGDFLC